MFVAFPKCFCSTSWHFARFLSEAVQENDNSKYFVPIYRDDNDNRVIRRIYERILASVCSVARYIDTC